jgi:hypothetical protein
MSNFTVCIVTTGFQSAVEVLVTVCCDNGE